jgi:hypothetical protein
MTTTVMPPSPEVLTIGVLSTAGDHPAAWLCAGQALQRVLLVATRRGFGGRLRTVPKVHGAEPLSRVRRR